MLWCSGSGYGYGDISGYMDRDKDEEEEGACSRYNIQLLGAGAFREHAEEKRLESSHTII